MIRILQLGMTDNLGGIETFLINYYRHLDHSQIQFDFVNIYKNKLCFQDEIEQMGGSVFSVPSYYRHPIKYIKSVKKIINHEKYKIVHCNMNSAAMIFPLVAGKLSNAKIVITHAHNSSSDKGFLKQTLHTFNKHFIKYLANTYFSCSNESSKWFYNKKIRKGNNFFTIYNAVDTGRFEHDVRLRKELRKKMHINDNDFVIGHIGRFVKQKNQKWLVEKFQKELLEDKLKLVFVGKGELLQEIRNMVDVVGINKNIIFLEPTLEIEKIYNVFDIFIMPSLYEGLPNTAIEAQCVGIPTLLSENITKEAKIISNCEFFSLDETSGKILDTMKRITNKEKTNHKLERFNLFDISFASKKITQIYEELCK